MSLLRRLSFGRSFRRARYLRPRPRRFLVEPLETRLLFSITPTFAGTAFLVAGTDVDVNQQLGNQREEAIAINPVNPSQAFVYSNREAAGDMAARSTTAGVTWVGANGADKIIADGADTLPVTRGDPSTAWDQFGNLFIAYLLPTPNGIQVALSTDGGQTFNPLAALTAGGSDNRDQETIVTGAGSVWVTWRENGAIQASGAQVTGLGTVGAFSAPVAVPGSGAGSFGDIAIGPNGQVLVTYQDNTGGQGASNIFVNLDPDGLGPNPFGAAINATTTNVGGTDLIPPQSNSAGIDAEAGLGYDTDPSSPFFGRAYLVYTDEAPDESNDTNIFVRFSNNNGTNWSAPVRVNDDATTRSQFLPRIAVDPTTGFVGVSWHDSRNDAGAGGAGDTDNVANTDAQLFASVSVDGGVTFRPNIQVSDGTSRSAAAEPAAGGFRNLGYGDYSGLTFFGGSLYPSWADNSNSTGNNPNGALSNMDIYVDRVIVEFTGGQTVTATGGGGNDTYFIRTDPSGSFVQFYENNPTLTGVPTYTASRAALSSIVVNGDGGDDRLTLSFANGNPITGGGVTYDGGSNGATGDDLRLQGGTFGTVTYTATGSGSGTVSLDGSLITYTGLEPITDNTSASNRIFTINIPGAQTVHVGDDGIAANGVSRIDSGGTGGFETVTFANPTTSLTVNTGDGDDTIVLAALDSTLTAPTTVNGGTGNDSFTVNATAAAALILDGQADSDTFTVNFGSLAGTVSIADTGGSGTDSLFVNGTAGSDTLVVAATAVTRGAETVNYSGVETLTVNAGDAGDSITVNGTSAPTTVTGGTGDDTFVVNATGAAGLTLDGQGDSDGYTVNFGSLAGTVNVADSGGSGVDSLLVNGTAGDDALVVTATAVTRGAETVTYSGIEALTVNGGDGNDTLTINGTGAPTTLLGGNGDDAFVVNATGVPPLTLDGQEGSDSYTVNFGSLVGPVTIADTGTVGIDTLLVNGTAGDDVIVLTDTTITGVGLGTVTFSGIEAFSVDAGAGNDLIDGSALTIAATLLGGSGNDTLLGGAGNDNLDGGTGDDKLHGGAGSDTLTGGDGNDALFGDAGNDLMNGGAGDDHLYGGAGNDTQDGGAGADIIYGGTGDDRLIADSREDRLIDWFGNFNDFVVPGPSFGAPTIVRSPNPQTQQFLLALAAADGSADPNGELQVVVPGSVDQQANSGPGGRAS